MTSTNSAAQSFAAKPTAKGLQAWQKRMGFTYVTAAVALGMGRSGYAKMLAGRVPGRSVKSITAIDRRTALACVAIEAGLSPSFAVGVTP